MTDPPNPPPPSAAAPGWIRREFLTHEPDDAPHDDDDDGVDGGEGDGPEFHPVLHPDRCFPTLEGAVAEDAAGGLDLVEMLRSVRIGGGGGGAANEDSDDDDDFVYGAIKIVNYCRRRQSG